MKQIIFTAFSTLGTFSVGLIAVTSWLVSNSSLPGILDIPLLGQKIFISTPNFSQTPPNSKIYSVGFCEFSRNWADYGGKIVRIQAFYNQEVDTAALTGPACESRLCPSCPSNRRSPCKKIWNRLGKALNSGRYKRVKNEAVGRYAADTVDPNPL